jgi:hypothetical protein
MTSGREELDDLRCRIAKLPPRDQLLLAEEILRAIRKSHFTDQEALREALRWDFEELLVTESNTEAGRAAR